VPLTLHAADLRMVPEPNPSVRAVALGAFSDELDVVDPLVAPAIRAALQFEGKLGTTAIVAGEDGQVVVVVGLGDRAALTAARLRRAAVAATTAAASAPSLAVLLARQAGEAGMQAGDALAAVAGGVLAASYRFSELRGRPDDPPALATVELVTGTPAYDGEPDDRQAADDPPGDPGVGLDSLEAVGVIARATGLARDLVNRPGGSLSAAELGEVAEGVAAEAGLACEIWDLARCRQERMGGLLGVNAGSAAEPRLIHLSWAPPDAHLAVALVGKGITFDSGGLSLKTNDGMKSMKADMGGAAAVIAAMAAVPTVAPRLRVDAWVASTDNMPSGSALKVGDVLTIRNGTSVEVLNTDAEGRLVLADALSLAVEHQPDVVVDLATLTGACVVALGRGVAGVMGDDDVVDQLRAAAERTGEAVWPLPLPDRYRTQLDSKVADLRNVGEGRYGGALIAGLFLREFVSGVPWAHVDVAGPVFADDPEPGEQPGATGFGVRLLADYLAAMGGVAPGAERSMYL